MRLPVTEETEGSNPFIRANFLSNKQWPTSRKRTVIANETDCNFAIARLIPHMAVVRGELTVCGADS